MIVFDKFLIGGEWVAPDGRGHFDVHDASTEEVIGRIPDGSPVDVDRAVAAARRAFQPWAETAPARRAQVLREIAEGIRKRREELVDVILGELGAPRPMTEQFMVDFPASTIQFYADLLATYPFEERIGNSLVVKEPVGVVAAITPWNYPLHQIVAKLGPALAAGCSVVLKPSEVVPLSCFMLAEIVNGTSIPAGVFNFLSGAGAVVGEAMAAHPDVDMVSFTGSTAAGRRVAELAARSVKKVSLELGGKSASVILDDADFEKAVRASLNHAFINCGQTCASWTRMLVPRARQEEAIGYARDELARSNAVGDPRVGQGAARAARVGAPARARARLHPVGDRRRARGSSTGGIEPPDGLERGYYVRPTLFADVTQRDEDRAGGDLRPRLHDPPVRRRGRRGSDRERHDLRPRRRGLVARRDSGHARRAADPHRAARHQRRAVQSARAVRRREAVGQRPRARQVRTRGVPRA